MLICFNPCFFFSFCFFFQSIKKGFIPFIERLFGLFGGFYSGKLLSNFHLARDTI